MTALVRQTRTSPLPLEKYVLFLGAISSDREVQGYSSFVYAYAIPFHAGGHGN